MFEQVDGLGEGVVAFRAVGLVTADDYHQALGPAVEAAAAGGHKVRLYLEMGEGFDGYDTSAMMADTALGIRHLGSFERIAIVTDAEWLRRAIHLVGGLIPGDVRLFPVVEAGAARDWIGS